MVVLLPDVRHCAFVSERNVENNNFGDGNVSMSSDRVLAYNCHVLQNCRRVQNIIFQMYVTKHSHLFSTRAAG